MNKKKKIKIALTTAVTFSAFVAIAPVQAASTVNVSNTVTNTINVMKKPYNTYTRASFLANPKTVETQVNTAKKTYKNALNVVNTAGGKKKAGYNDELKKAYVNITRADGYTTAHRTAEKDKKALERELTSLYLSAVNQKEIEVKNKYNALVKTVSTAKKNIEKVYGTQVKLNLKSKFTNPTEQSLQGNIKVYYFYQKAEAWLAKGKIETAEARVKEIDQLYKKVGTTTSLDQAIHKYAKKVSKKIADAKIAASEEPITEEKITDTTLVTTTAASVFNQADGKGTIVISIPPSKIVVASSITSNAWYKVTYNKKTGYVSGTSLEQVKTGDPLTDRNSYQFIDLRTQSKVTANQIDRYISSSTVPNNKKSVLTGKGKVFIQAGKKYGINPLYLAAHAIHESAYGTSDISLGKNNLFGFGSYDAAPYIASYRFNSVDACIEYIAKQLKATYLKPGFWKFNGAYLGFKTNNMKAKRIDANSEGMNFYYASDPEWGKKIAAHMERILPFKQADYKNAVINTVYPALPSEPNGSDLFPKNIEIVANKALTLYNSQAVSTTKTVLKSGTSLTLLEKANDYWVRIKYDNKEYWTNSINFVEYKKAISVKNLGRVSGTEGNQNLNVRKEASASSAKLGELTPNSYVQLVLKKDGTLMMNDKKTWYQIQLDDGTYGWVSKSYIVQELK